MDLRSYIRQHRHEWAELEDALKRMSKSKRKLSPDTFEQFQYLYQRVSQHLSFCRTFFPQEEVTLYLNELVARAHNILYRDQVTSVHQLKNFFTKTFVLLLVEQKRFIFAAFLLFFIGTLGGFLSVLEDPLHLYSVLPAEIANGVNPENLGEQTEMAIDSASVSAYIMVNNIQVAIMAFLGGITLGAFTLYILIYNGIIVGGLAALFWHHGKTYDFWAYIVPHGMIELTAIFIAGGAGLLMGYRVLVPGHFSRAFQLKRQALRSVQLLLGTLPLFVLAGIIEGYITPAPIPLEVKYLFAFLTVIALILYVWAGIKINASHHVSKVHLD